MSLLPSALMQGVGEQGLEHTGAAGGGKEECEYGEREPFAKYNPSFDHLLPTALKQGWGEPALGHFGAGG